MLKSCHRLGSFSCTNSITPGEESDSRSLGGWPKIPQEEKWQELGSPDPPGSGEEGPGLPALPTVSWGVGAAEGRRLEAILGLEVTAGQSISVLTTSLYDTNFSSRWKGSNFRGGSLFLMSTEPLYGKPRMVVVGHRGCLETLGVRGLSPPCRSPRLLGKVTWGK